MPNHPMTDQEFWEAILLLIVGLPVGALGLWLFIKLITFPPGHCCGT